MSFHAYVCERRATRKLLAPYVCAGFPTPEVTVDVLCALAEAGADFIELGVPFSDPLADGPVIQAASNVALGQGMSLSGALELAEAYAARKTGVPLVLMGYANPFLALGASELGRRCEAADIGALIVPDLPTESQVLLAAPGVPPFVQFVAPNSLEDRLEVALALDPPFLYGVALFGVTGARQDVADYTAPFLRRMKGRTETPLLAGFGVSTPEQARTLADACDGVIVGSALVRALETAAPGHEAEAAGAFLKAFREALDRREV